MKSRLIISYALVVFAACLIAIHPHTAAPAKTIADISWPNCLDKLDSYTADRGIVGGLGGLNFHKNACLAREDRFKITDVYLNTGYAGINRARQYAGMPKNCAKTSERCLAYNYGWNATDFAVNQLFKAGVMPRFVWLDVEFGNTWSDDASINRVVITGMHDRLERYVPGKVGIYSYPFQWKIITNNWQNGWSAWVATGSSRPEEAISACNSSFTGGQVIYGQYTLTLDQNYVCR
jgi:hypothetical protein